MPEASAPAEELIAKTRDGQRVLFRPIRPDDKEHLKDGFARLSPRSRYMRFFRAIDHLSDEQLEYLTEIDYQDHFAWIAFAIDEPHSPGVGVARWIRLADEPEAAEGAVTVVDDWHHKGIGTTLLWLIARSAIERGVTHFKVWALGSNTEALDLLKDLGAIPKQWESGILEMDIPLPTDPADLEKTPAPLVLREVARGALAAEAKGARAGTRLSGADPNDPS
jgi:GNAT superfamily N-acetyltransferase